MIFKGYNTGLPKSTPNVWSSEGLHPAQRLVPAPYLPLIGYDPKNEEYKVWFSGKILAVDSSNYAVPAGLAIDIETALVDGDFDGAVNLYSATDIANGVKNFAGSTPEVNEPIVKSFFTGGDATHQQLNFVGAPVGMAFTDAWRGNGAGYGEGYGAGNPMDYTYGNYNMQQGITVRTRYFIEAPIVSSVSDLLVPGLLVFEGTPKPGDLVTFTANSNLKSFSIAPLAASAFAAGTAGEPSDAELIAEFDRVASLSNSLTKTFGKVIGRVFFVDDKWPKDLMQYVRTWNPNTTLANSKLNVAPGSATDGLPDTLVYAGQTTASTAKLAKVNIII